LNDDIFTFAQSGDRLLLPEIGHGDLIQRGQIG
jgi:hypothetical protein